MRTDLLDVRDTITALYKVGLKVHPCKQDKSPMMKWREGVSLKDTLIKYEENLGLVCGSINGNIEVIDIDLKFSDDPLLYEDYCEAVRSLNSEILDKVVIQKTVNNGIHIIYRCQTIDGNRLLAQSEDRKPLFETRGEGGYILIEPSTGYEVIQGSILNIPTINSTEREILFNCACRFNQYYKEQSEPSSSSKYKDVTPWDDYNERGDILGLLENHGWEIVSDEADKVLLKRPGTDNFCSADYTPSKNWFTVFSTSTSFDHLKAYTPFGVYAVLECNGDIREATKQLSQEGYGSKESGYYGDNGKEKGNALTEAINFIRQEYNLIRNEVTLNIEQDGKELSEQDINDIYINLKSNRIRVSQTDFHTIINSGQIKGENPLKKFLDRLPTDGSGHIDDLFNSIGLSKGMKKHESIIKIIFKKWVVGMIAGIYSNNYNSLMLILIGKKNTGKTEFFRRLFPSEIKDYFAQHRLDTNKDAEAIMSEKLLILNDELDQFTVREARSVRSFLSADSYTYRPPYGKKNITRKRLASVAGTSNDIHIINDWENNRRIVPIELEEIHFEDYNSVDKRGVFAEAYYLFKSGFKWDLTQDEIRNLDKFSHEFRTISIEEELVDEYFQKPSGDQYEMKSSSEIKVIIDQKTNQRMNIVRLGKALTKMGYDQVRYGNGRKYKVILKEYNAYRSDSSFNVIR